MRARTYPMTFTGYWREQGVGRMPAEPGIFVVYAGEFHYRPGTVELQKLIFIGDADDVRQYLTDYNWDRDWRLLLRPGQELCFTFTPCEMPHRERCYAALVHHHQPLANTTYMNFFPFHATTLLLFGKTDLLEPKFTVKPPRRKEAGKMR